MEQKSTRIFGLDLMRAIAIMMVLISHASIMFFQSDNIITNMFEFIGLHGVEVFFVLSGFLIGNILLKRLSKGNFSVRDVFGFWVRRWFRTLPLYFLILLVNSLLFYYLQNSFPERLWQFSVFLQNFFSEHPLFFPEAWSLSIEEFAYVLSPIVMLFFYKIVRNTQKAFLISTLSLVVIFVLTKIDFYIKNINEPLSVMYWDNSLKEVVVYRLDSIYYGFMVAYLHFYYVNWLKNNRYKLLIFGCILLLINHSLFVINSMHIKQSFYLDVLFLPVNSITICLFLPFLYYLKYSFKLLQNVIYKISIYSYAIYLLHYTFVLGLLNVIYPIKGLRFVQKIVYATVYIGMTVILSSIVYNFFEKPMTNLRDHKFFKR